MGKEDAMPANRNEAIRLLEEIIEGLKEGKVVLDGYRPIHIDKQYANGHTETILEIRFFSQFSLRGIE